MGVVHRYMDVRGLSHKVGFVDLDMSSNRQQSHGRALYARDRVRVMQSHQAGVVGLNAETSAYGDDFKLQPTNKRREG